MRSYIETAQ